jgi:proteasome accessory factor C
MDKFELALKLHKLLKQRRTPISRADLELKLGLKRATTTRLLSFCKDLLHMPIEFDRDSGGYRYLEKERESFELPGLWFNASELAALLSSQHLLANVQPGVLQPYLEPLQQRIEQLLTHQRAGGIEVLKRVRILPLGSREVKLENFQQVAGALVQRQRLRVVYSSRGKDELTERWLSPQRLIYYRDNWYLDAWCHLREGIRTFALDGMVVLQVDGHAKDLPDAKLDTHLTQTYGLFSGKATHKAVIHFSSNSARWVADELWHPDQLSRHLGDGKWELVVPYNNPTELIMDILRHGPDAEVISPPELRTLVAEKLSQSLRKYRKIRGT